MAALLTVLWWLLLFAAFASIFGAIGAALNRPGSALNRLGGPTNRRLAALEAENARLRAELVEATTPTLPAAGGKTLPVPTRWPTQPRPAESILVARQRVPASVVAEVGLMREQKIAAIKLVRERTGLGLLAAKEVVEAIQTDRY